MQKLTYVSLAILMVLVLLGFLFVSANSKAATINSERFYVDAPRATSALPLQQAPGVSVASLSPSAPEVAAGGVGNYLPSDPEGNEVYNPVGGDANPVPSSSCFPRDRLTAEDLLPKDSANSRWSQVNPAGQGDLNNVNFLSAGFHVGIDTVGSSMKNANLQLRSEPANPQRVVSPWLNPSIEPSDVGNRKGFEIGSTPDF